MSHQLIRDGFTIALSLYRNFIVNPYRNKVKSRSNSQKWESDKRDFIK